MFPTVATTEAKMDTDERRFPITFEHINADTTLRFERLFRGELRSSRYRIAMWYWELSAFRSDWSELASHYREIWVASAFGSRAVAAISSVPVHVMPPPAEVRPANGDRARRAFGISPDTFVFLYVFDFSSYVDRKNPGCLVDAFASEFGHDARFALVLKISHAEPSTPGFRALVSRCEDFGNTRIVSDALRQHDLDDVYAMANCYVSPHRSEGFGLTLAEAMLRGCPVIATDYGATTDFVTEATGYPLRYQLMELKEDQGPYQHGYVWADPSIEHLRELMREVVEHPEEAKRRAIAGQRFVAARYSVETRGRELRARLMGVYDAIGLGASSA